VAIFITMTAAPIPDGVNEVIRDMDDKLHKRSVVSMLCIKHVGTAGAERRRCQGRRISN
jgi:hypothetical protein